jgi:hypothetical protein
MSKQYTYEQLLEKIVRAKVTLEGSLKEHPVSCPAEQGDGPCTCGADKHNAAIRAALRKLEL